MEKIQQPKPSEENIEQPILKKADKIIPQEHSETVINFAEFEKIYKIIRRDVTKNRRTTCHINSEANDNILSFYILFNSEKEAQTANNQLTALGQKPSLENKTILLKIKILEGQINLINKKYRDLIIDETGTIENYPEILTSDLRTTKRGPNFYNGKTASF